MGYVLIFALGLVLGFPAGAMWMLTRLDDIEDAEFEELEAYDYGDIYKER